MQVKITFEIEACKNDVADLLQRLEGVEQAGAKRDETSSAQVQAPEPEQKKRKRRTKAEMEAERAAEAAKTKGGQIVDEDPFGIDEEKNAVITVDDVKMAAKQRLEKTDPGEVKAIFAKYDAAKISDLAKEDYASVYRELQDVAD